ncbi:hypothetical protein TNCV_1140851 [Trichonephila clavipes]|nr:hypothetical protein TNCV_1140851 [Trichonephila clavipes]
MIDVDSDEESEMNNATPVPTTNDRTSTILTKESRETSSSHRETIIRSDDRFQTFPIAMVDESGSGDELHGQRVVMVPLKTPHVERLIHVLHNLLSFTSHSYNRKI